MINATLHLATNDKLKIF